MSGCVPLTGPPGQGGGMHLWWVVSQEGRLFWAGMGVVPFLWGLSRPSEAGVRCGPCILLLPFPPDHLSLFLFLPLLSLLLPLFSLHRDLGVRWRPGWQPCQGGWTKSPGPGSGPCYPAAVSRPLPQHRWGVEAGTPSAPPRLTPPPFPALPLSHFLKNLSQVSCCP